MCGNCLNNDAVGTDPTKACVAPSKPPTRPIDNAVNLKLTLDYDYNQAIANLEAFKAKIIADLAAALAAVLSSDRIKIISITKGSTIVNFTILPTDNTSQASSSQAVSLLQDQIGQSGSPLRNGAVTSSVQQNQNLSATSVTVSYEKCDNGQWAVAGTCPNSGPSTTSMIIGVCVAFGSCCLIGFACYCFNKRSRSNGKHEELALQSLEEDVEGRGEEGVPNSPSIVQDTPHDIPDDIGNQGETVPY